ncbi:MAG: protein BatD [bacterium]|nr:protein BatD [bacterium]
MSYTRALFIALAGLLLALPGWAQGIRVTIDRTEATVRDELVLSVTVESSRARPELPDLSAFHVRDAGRSTRFEMGAGRSTSSIVYQYVLVALRAGTFTIGPATVEIDGRSYQSRPFRVRIVEASAQSRESEGLFLRATVSSRTPYVGEQVIYRWRFYRRVRVGDARVLPMEFDGFVVEDLGEVREYNSTWNGQEFLVSEIRKALFPQEEGTLIIPASQLQCQVAVASRSRRRRSFFDDLLNRQQVENRVLSTSPIELTVRPLPSAPQGFTGLVGDFDVRSEISKRELKVGESATLKITVSGTGNVSMISEPRLAALDQFKTYDDKPSSSINRSGDALTGSRSYSKALVPLEPGELSVPAVRLSYFDPKAGSYRTATAGQISLRVAPAEGKEELRLTESVAPSTGKVAVRILADDILPIYKRLDAVAAVPFGHRPEPLWLGGVFAPPLLFLGMIFVNRRRRQFEQNLEQRRRKAALGRAMKGMRRVAEAVRQGQAREAAQLASRCLREYVGDKVGLEGSAFTPAEADEQLRRCGVDDELVKTTHERLVDLDAAQYGGGAADTDRLAVELKELLKQLERQIRV